MKKVLILLEKLGSEETNEKESLACDVAKIIYERGGDPHIFANEIKEGTMTEKLQAIGIRRSDLIHNATMLHLVIDKKYDAAVALDEWGVNNVPRGVDVKNKVLVQKGNTAEVIADKISDILSKPEKK